MTTTRRRVIEAGGYDVTWTCAGPCKLTFHGDDGGSPDSEGCGETVCYICLRDNKFICPACGERYIDRSQSRPELRENAKRLEERIAA